VSALAFHTPQRLLGAEDVARYAAALAASFVDDNDAIAWCPSPGCAQAVAYSARRATVACGEGHRFCFSCRRAAHAPCSCDQQEVWLKKEEHKKSGAGKLTKCDNVKPCPNPNCAVPTTKISGCMCDDVPEERSSLPLPIFPRGSDSCVRTP
jgi:ariadne-1